MCALKVNTSLVTQFIPYPTPRPESPPTLKNNKKTKMKKTLIVVNF